MISADLGKNRLCAGDAICSAECNIDCIHDFDYRVRPGPNRSVRDFSVADKLAF